jgi:hypothetical protein
MAWGAIMAILPNSCRLEKVIGRLLVAPFCPILTN